MKTAAVFFSGLLLSALTCAPAAAETVRVRLTARVSFLDDPGTVLHGQIAVGQRLTGTYVYNTNTPDIESDPSTGYYIPYANEARVRFASGGVVFESVQPTQGIEIHTTANPWGGRFMLDSRHNKPLPTGVNVNTIYVDFDGAGNLTETDALPAVAPDVQSYFRKEVVISGGGFDIRANIEAAELIVTDAIHVSPAAGSFVPGQRFDAALTLPRNASVASAQATSNGVTLPLNYPGSCQLLPPNSAGKPSLLCPNADAVLPQAAGAPIDWNVVLTNGTTLTQTVNWTLAQ